MFTIGEKVAHPMHGAGVIEQVITRQEKEGERQFYRLRLSVGSMTLLLPCDTCDAIGLRPTILPAEALALLEKLEQVPLEDVSNWNQRYRENMTRIKSGDLRQVAVVVRTLQHRERLGKRSLSNGERKMLSGAKKILISELALVLGKEYEEIEHIIEQKLI